MDTKVQLYTLIDYKTFYGNEPEQSVSELIADIPSETLINYISGFEVNLYLRENSEETAKFQFSLVDSLLSKTGKEYRDKWTERIKKMGNDGHAPIMFWTYSNLLFYEEIFSAFNQMECRDLNAEEAIKVFDAYLIINQEANKKTQIEDAKIQQAIKDGAIEEIAIPSFIFQKDYVSTTDFGNQVMRGKQFFEYLENSAKYSKVIQDYYARLNVSGYKSMFKTLLGIFDKIGVEKIRRMQLINLYENHSFINMDYVRSLCINASIKNYTSDNSFSTIRKQMLYQIAEFRFFALDINFLIDQFYKAQIFAFFGFLKSIGNKDEFLSIKGKEFMEDVYLKNVIETCFPDYLKFLGANVVSSTGEELTDVYLRDKNNVCLIEFKDVLLNANEKNEGNKEKLFNAVDKKFVKNEKNKPKGITQLINAIKDIEDHSVIFDKSLSREPLEIFPVIVYTDYTFSVHGLNKLYRKKFMKDIELVSERKNIIHAPIFIYLSFFELHEEYFKTQKLDFFELLKGYNEHISHEQNSLSSFEDYCRSYMSEHNIPDLGESKRFESTITEIVKSI